MKKGFLKKLAICLSLGLGVMTMAACQSTDQSQAKVDPKQCAVNLVVKQEIVGTEVKPVYYAQGMIALLNNTIYDAKTWTLDYSIYYAIGGETKAPVSITSEETTLYVVHGQGVGWFFDIKLDDAIQPYAHPELTLVKITVDGGTPVKFANLWESYIGWWVAAIVIVGVALIFFAASLFGKHLSKNEVADLFKGHVASSVVFSLFMLIICLFPLIFGAWFSTIILLLALAGSFVGGGALALIAFGLAK